MCKAVVQSCRKGFGTPRKRGLTVRVTTLLDCPPERAWEEVQKPYLLRYVAAPLLRFEAVRPTAFPERWREGKYLVRIKLFSIFPLGAQWIGIEFPPNPTPGVSYQVRDNGHGQLMRVWDHLITLESAPDGRTRYTDRVEVNAGLLTPFAWFFAKLFYRHRQRRWRKLAKRNFTSVQADQHRCDRYVFGKH